MIFREKVVLITGGGTGIGRATAERFAAEGASVWIVGRNEETLRETSEAIGPACRYEICDVADEAGIAAVVEKPSRLDMVVSNAAVSFPTRLEGDPMDKWRRMIEINQWGAVNTCLAAGRRMLREKTPGRVVIVSSILGELAEPGGTAYGMAKAALNQFTRQLAVEWAAHGILVNGIAPGYVVTPMGMVDGKQETESEWFRQFFVHPERPRIPLARPGRPEEIAEAILFMAHPRNTYCTGVVLTVDGGLTVRL